MLEVFPPVGHLELPRLRDSTNGGFPGDNVGMTRYAFVPAALAAVLAVVSGCGSGTSGSSGSGSRGLTVPDMSVNVIAHDPALAAAKVEAQKHWPEFVKSFRKDEPGLAHDVEISFRTRDGAYEGDWVMVTGIAGDNVTGKLASSPGNIEYVYGDEITVNRARVEDWIVSRGEKVEQGYFSHDAVMGAYGG